MSEPTSPPGPPPQPPSDPPAQPPPGPPPGGPTSSPPAGQPNTVMIVLAYLWILSLVPLLVEKEDAEVQWHAKHGLLLFAVDIAVPRDLDPAIANFDDVYLYTVDDLQEVIQENLKSREEAAEQAKEIIEFHVEEFLGWLRSLDAVTLIQDYRSRAQAHRDEVLDKAKRMLDKGRSAEEALEFLANTLTNKLLHAPSSRLREAGSAGQQELLEAANTLFQLDQPADRK